MYNSLYGQSVTFEEKTHLIKYITGTMGQAKCAADMNGDGLDDITRVSKEGIHIDFQKQDNSFQYKFFPMDVRVLPIWSICAGDFNDDNVNDMFFCGQEKVSFVNYSIDEGKYTEIVLPDNIFSQRSTIFDIDNDGDLDAFVCNDTGKSIPYRNNGSGFLIADHTLINTSDLSGNYSAIWSDYNNDGRTDLYISKCRAEALPGDPRRTNLLYKNNGNGTFTEVGLSAGVNDNGQSWTSVVEDFDNDGDMDILVLNHDQKNRFYRNNGNGTFTDVINSTGIDAEDLHAFEAVGGDFNNDGNLDIISDLTNQLYLGNGDLTFTGQKLPFKPAAIGDFNNDGFLDVTCRSQLWMNDTNSNHWIKLKLRGVESNTNGIGARVEIYGKWGRQIRELRSGQSYSPMNTLDLHFGLGTENKIDSLVIKWPSGIITRLKNITSDSTYFIVEGYCELANIQLPVNDKMLICPGQNILIEGPSGYKKYLWSDGTEDKNLNIKFAGKYCLIYEDTLGCRGISDIISVEEADKNIPEIEIANSIYPVCDGNEIILRSSAGNDSKWSDGSENGSEIIISHPGIYYAAIDSFCSDGLLKSKPIDIEFFETPAPVIKEIVHLTGDSIQVILECDSCLWYSSSGTLLFSECNVIIPDVTQDTTFSVFNQKTFEGIIQSGGKSDTSGYNNNYIYPCQMLFTAREPFILDSVDLYIKGETNEGIRNIFLLNSNNEVLDSVKADLKTGKNTILLGFELQPGQYVLSTDRTDQLMNIGPLDYPYLIADFGQIDSSSRGLNFYPYFYNWKVKALNSVCRNGISLSLKPSQTEQLVSGCNIELAPIPASDQIAVNNIEKWDFTNWAIAGINGTLMKSGKIYKDDLLTINIQDLPNGIYILRLNTSEKAKYFKIIVLK